MINRGLSDVLERPVGCGKGGTHMKRMVTIMLVGGALLALPSASSVYAKGGLGNMMQKMIGGGYTDADGDGVNDRMSDADGDGIPNGQDPDYVRPQDGSGAGATTGSGTGTGVCDGTGPKGAGPRR